MSSRTRSRQALIQSFNSLAVWLWSAYCQRRQGPGWLGGTWGLWHTHSDHVTHVDVRKPSTGAKRSVSDAPATRLLLFCGVCVRRCGSAELHFWMCACKCFESQKIILDIFSSVITHNNTVLLFLPFVLLWVTATSRGICAPSLQDQRIFGHDGCWHLTETLPIDRMTLWY